MANSFELRYQLRTLLLLYYKICPRAFIRISIPWPTVGRGGGVKSFDLPALPATAKIPMALVR